MSAINAPITVAPQRSDLSLRARQLATELGLPFYADFRQAASTSVLLVTGDRLELHSRGGTPGPVAVDFAAPPFLWRLKHGGGVRQAIARAVGLKAGNRPLVIDATAGFGEDGFILASLGCTVHLIERSPVIAALLADGLDRARSHPHLQEAAARLFLHRGDSILLLNGPGLPHTDVIYLDPMYPDIDRSAGARKEMVYLRRTVGDDPDTALLLKAALNKATKRVVVKRPRLAPAIEGPPPSFAMVGKSSRFDVYLR